MTEPTHYEVLSLPKSLLEESNGEQIPQIIKQAYHRALLRHHPDKAQAPSSRHQHTSTYNRSTTTATSTSNPIYTVDQIARAYTTLSTSTSRSQYDRYLLTQQNSSKPSQSTFQTGIETIDLDDLDYSESPGAGETHWYRPCRCGNEQGFAFGEDDLEEAGDLGELIVGCQDCSLWLRVCFAVVEDDDGTGEEAAAKQPG
ncbi:Diphthamide biosynthesis protein 4 [Cytospora mali]|uniref:Diphthamide biosynthesis protein 4 n=1 Tax=Cytospora mali TaxID=578113 RepID=A0A194VUK1_CYTMA|nr:Diphthamide biosynthesis protein 4 [Valsa mali]